MSAIVTSQSIARRQGRGSADVNLRGTSICAPVRRFLLAILTAPHFTGLAKWARGAHFL
jgi:hypothetical protein